MGHVPGSRRTYPTHTISCAIQLLCANALWCDGPLLGPWWSLPVATSSAPMCHALKEAVAFAMAHPVPARWHCGGAVVPGAGRVGPGKMDQCPVQRSAALQTPGLGGSRRPKGATTESGGWRPCARKRRGRTALGLVVVPPLWDDDPERWRAERSAAAGPGPNPRAQARAKSLHRTTKAINPYIYI